MEWRVRNEVVGRLARRHGIATPLNDAMSSLLALIDARVQAPDLLLLDEPVTGLDLPSQLRILEVIGDHAGGIAAHLDQGILHFMNHLPDHFLRVLGAVERRVQVGADDVSFNTKHVGHRGIAMKLQHALVA